MTQELKGSSDIGDYLWELVENHEHRQQHGWSKVIWDIACAAQDDGTWRYSKNRHLIRQAYWANRDPIYQDLFSKLRSMS